MAFYLKFKAPEIMGALWHRWSEGSFHSVTPRLFVACHEIFLIKDVGVLGYHCRSVQIRENYTWCHLVDITCTEKS